MKEKTRSEHLAWCKQRALEYAEQGNYQEAISSMISDLQKHPETANHAGAMLAVGLMMSNNLNSKHAVIEFIEGFN